MTELLMALMVWVSASLGVEVPDRPPVLKFYTEEQRLTDFCNINMASVPDKWRDVTSCSYAPDHYWRNGVVVLADDWDVTSLKDVSSLVHELTHHVQFLKKNEEYGCFAERELEAFSVQKRFIEITGKDFYEVTGYDQFRIMLYHNRCPEDRF